MERRSFLKGAAAIPGMGATSLLAGALPAVSRAEMARKGGYRPGRIDNEYSLFLPGEKEALQAAPSISHFGSGVVTAHHQGASQTLKVGDVLGGWQLMAIIPWLNGTPTAVFEKRVTHRGALVYLTVDGGVIAHIPKGVGDLSKIRPRAINAQHGVRLERPAQYVPGPDAAGNYILNSNEDPCYENVAALGAEYIGWTLVANEQAGPLKSVMLEADGRSRQLGKQPEGQQQWAPDVTGRLFDPTHLLPSEYLYQYQHGYSKRTLLGGYLPVADTGVWNPVYKVGYEVMLLLTPGEEGRLIGRVRSILPSGKGDLIPPGDSGYTTQPSGVTTLDRYWNGSAAEFYAELVGIWNHWHHFFEDRMQVEIPDEWLLDGARAGITLSRCSYRGLRPTYQVGEGAYTKIPERSHALFPVAHYEFVWAQQLWNLTDEVEPYFQHYLENYILPDGNFLYNTQDQVEAPLNVGIFLENSARAYDYSHNLEALQKRLPVLRRMIDYVLDRYEYSKRTFPQSDRRYGLIWGSPEADLGDPHDDAPESHPFYYQNSVWTWRGLHEHARCLNRAGSENQVPALQTESRKIAAIAAEMRANIERSLRATLEASTPEMKQAGISPFTPFDTHHKPADLSSYENHRFMMDWFTADWGDAKLDEGHFRHREVAGMQILGIGTDGAYPRVSNFMEHGTLAGRIRQEDYRPFLLNLYGQLCYTYDSGNRYSPEDAMMPGSFPGEGSPYGWSAVVNSELQATLGLRWLLCYEEHDRDLVHLQKAAPKHWFGKGERIHVAGCPTRFGPVSWTTTASGSGWQVQLELPENFSADIAVHIHTPDGRTLKSSNLGTVQRDQVLLSKTDLAGKRQLTLQVG